MPVKMSRLTRPLQLSAALVALAAGCAFGQEDSEVATDGAAQQPEQAADPSKPTMRVRRATSAITIDGRLDDEAWVSAVAIDDFTQVDPVEGAAPTQRTVMRLLYDENNLYVGVRCYETDPSLIIARDMTRDSGLRDDDHITIFIDTFLDRRNGYLFIIGAAGGKSDGLIRAGRREMEWDGIWHGKATIDDEGYCNIVGRIKDMVIRGGENVYPREIEEFLYGHPQVQDVQVIGVPDDKYGEELCAWIILRDGETATEDDIKAYCKGQIAHYKIPRYVKFVDGFPMTVTGKIQKFLMREQMIEIAQQVTAAQQAD